MEQSKVQISIILPFFNSEETLEEAIQSLLNQSYVNFELILIDNQSTDNSYKIAYKFENQDTRIVLLKEEKQGVVYAFNKGLSKAKGDYIVRMDADDISHKKRLEKQIRYLQDHKKVDVVSCLVHLKSNIEQNQGFKTYVDWLNSIQTYKDIYLNRFVEYPIVNPSVMVRKEIFETYGTYKNGDFPEDYEFWLRLLSEQVIIEKIPEYLFTWRDTLTRLTRTHSNYFTDKFYNIKIRYLAKELRVMEIQEVWIWGAGRKTKQRLNYLIKENIQIAGFIDVDSRKTAKANCIHYTEITNKQKFILSFVGNTGVRQQIKSYLEGLRYQEGTDFFLLA